MKNAIEYCINPVFGSEVIFVGVALPDAISVGATVTDGVVTRTVSVGVKVVVWAVTGNRYNEKASNRMVIPKSPFLIYTYPTIYYANNQTDS